MAPRILIPLETDRLALIITSLGMVSAQIPADSERQTEIADTIAYLGNGDNWVIFDD
jgi:hypothetical protein